MSDSLPLVRVLVSKYPVLCQKSNCDNFDDAEEVYAYRILFTSGLLHLYHDVISNTFLLQYLTSVSLVESFSSVFFSPTDDRNEKIDFGFQ